MMMMKSHATMATFLLFFSSFAILVKEISGSYNPNLCCFEFYSSPLNMSQVVNFKKTDALCPKEGVIFMKKTGLKGQKGMRVDRVCVNPSQQWVKDIMEAKQNQAKPVKNSRRQLH